MKPKRPKTVPVHCAHDTLAPVASLVPNPKNPNRHPKAQIELLAKLIAHHGWRAPVIVSKRSGFIVAGHGRVEAALHLGLDVVPVNHQDFATDADELAFLVADNRIPELAEMDDGALAALLKELAGTDLELAGLVAELESSETAGAPSVEEQLGWMLVGLSDGPRGPSGDWALKRRVPADAVESLTTSLARHVDRLLSKRKVKRKPKPKLNVTPDPSP